MYVEKLVILATSCTLFRGLEGAWETLRSLDHDVPQVWTGFFDQTPNKAQKKDGGSKMIFHLWWESDVVYDPQ